MRDALGGATGAVVTIIVAALLAVHPLHTTATTVSYEPAQRSIAITVRLFTSDLGAALARGPAGGDVCGYVRAALVVTDGTGPGLEARTCATTHEGDVTWVKLELRVARPPTDLQIHNVLLFELFGDEINIVQATLNGAARTLVFTNGDGAKRLS